MAVINGSYLKENGLLVTQNKREALLLIREGFPLYRLYYFYVRKNNLRYCKPQKIKHNDFNRYYNLINTR